jgi:hypothetical protein
MAISRIRRYWHSTRSANSPPAAVSPTQGAIEINREFDPAKSDGRGRVHGNRKEYSDEFLE